MILQYTLIHSFTLSIMFRVCIFLAIEHVVFIMKFIVNLNIADIPEEVQIQLDR